MTARAAIRLNPPYSNYRERIASASAANRHRPPPTTSPSPNVPFPRPHHHRLWPRHPSQRPVLGDARDVFGDARWADMMLWWVGPAPHLAGLDPHGDRLRRRGRGREQPGTPDPPAHRDAQLGHPVVGSDSDLRDFTCYAAGVLMAGLIHRRLRRRARNLPPDASIAAPPERRHIWRRSAVGRPRRLWLATRLVGPSPPK